MSYSDTGETSRFKAKYIESITNLVDTSNCSDNSQDASNSWNTDNQTYLLLPAATSQKAEK